MYLYFHFVALIMSDILSYILETLNIFYMISIISKTPGPRTKAMFLFMLITRV